MSKTRHIFSILLVGTLYCQMPYAIGDSALNDGIALYNKREYKKAVDALTKSAAANPNLPTPLYYQALSYYQLGDPAKAKILYSTIVRKFPSSDEAKFAATYLQRVDPKYVNTVGAPPVSRSATSAAPSTAASAAPIGDMTSFDAANATIEDLGKLPDTASVPFSHGNGGHLMVDTQINGRTVKMMFDTGASTCLIGKNQLESAGVMGNVIQGQRTRMGGVGNTVNSAAPMIVDLKVGGIQRHMPIMVQDHFDLPPLLGQTFYNGYQYDIDNQSGVIRFTKKGSSRNSVGFDSIEVPFETVGNNLVVVAQINGHNCPMYFDTGAAINLFDMRTFLSMGLSIPSDATATMVGGVGGYVPGYMFTISSMRLGSIQKNNLPVTVVTSGGPPLPLLGQPFLRDRRFTIDNDKKVIRFSR
ncbi:MAG: retroviral-like aspartic protease family protein [Cyanobacteria bacterium SZAS-4]|nr:retroviral-like aspartic protease family protein [Cyanobacteria bacterium SZAS-4]